jgi:hypothetical protein
MNFQELQDKNNELIAKSRIKRQRRNRKVNQIEENHLLNLLLFLQKRL